MLVTQWRPYVLIIQHTVETMVHASNSTIINSPANVTWDSLGPTAKLVSFKLIKVDLH